MTLEGPLQIFKMQTCLFENAISMKNSYYSASKKMHYFGNGQHFSVENTARIDDTVESGPSEVSMWAPELFHASEKT